MKNKKNTNILVYPSPENKRGTQKRFPEHGMGEKTKD